VADFRYRCPIQIRYGDIDAQRHVNNSRHFTYMEQARTSYLQHLGLWDGKSFEEIGIILAEISCAFLVPIRLDRKIQVGVRTSKIGTKSIEMAYAIEDAESGEVLSEGRSVVVAYDYAAKQSIPVPAAWREAIARFEGVI
jgi:acyl-CoA thioester hydrolase